MAVLSVVALVSLICHEGRVQVVGPLGDTVESNCLNVEALCRGGSRSAECDAVGVPTFSGEPG